MVASREASLERLRVVVANSGGSNTGDGLRGLQTARATQVLAAELLDVEPAQVGVASTGVIGPELPREKLLGGLRSAVAELGDDADGSTEAGLRDVAHILTIDHDSPAADVVEPVEQPSKR